ncbi:ABC transporter ATP-binding protein [Undibacterium arcticum]
MINATHTKKTILSISHVAVHFGGLVAISDMTFDVKEGELVSLIGPNGAGKKPPHSTSSQGFFATDKWRGAFSRGSASSSQAARSGRCRTGADVSKDQSFSRRTRCSKNVLTGLHRHGRASAWATLLSLPSVKREEARQRETVWEILDFIGIAEYANELGGALPYGAQRLLGVAVALAANPTLLLLDEPASGMNPSETADFMELLSKIRARGISILLVEHDMPLVMGVSDRIVVLNYGKIIADGPPVAIQQNPEVISAYLGHGVKHA